MTEQIKRPPMRNGDEYDALTPWRHRLCWRPGERSAIKRRFRRRERRLGKIKLTEFLAGDALSLRSGNWKDVL